MPESGTGSWAKATWVGHVADVVFPQHLDETGTNHTVYRFGENYTFSRGPKVTWNALYEELSLADLCCYTEGQGCKRISNSSNRDILRELKFRTQCALRPSLYSFPG